LTKIDPHIKILVTGASGQLGNALQLFKDKDEHLTFVFLDKKELDITNYTAVKNAIQKYQPDYILNTAAYTKVDQAENERDLAFLINEKGVQNLVETCENETIGLVHISTDYVFDGNKRNPYHPDDTTNPRTVYGASKLAGEQSIINGELDQYWIIRTSWLYSPFGHNFLKTMLRLAGEREALTIVNDQIGNPTSALDLAAVLVEIFPKLSKANSGTYHFGNKGETTWFDFAKTIFEIKSINITLSPITTAQYPTLAQRPLYSVLDTKKVEEEFKVSIRDWKIALSEMLTNY